MRDQLDMVHAIEEGERIRVLSPMATQTIRKWTLVTNHVLSCNLNQYICYTNMLYA
jgi:hypothetical protein